MKYGIIGIKGRMGQEIDSLFTENGHQLVFSYDLDVENKTEQPDVLIDFSLPDALEDTLDFAKDMEVPTVIGTTGYSEDQIDKIKNLSEIVPVVQAYNFSIGIQMLLKMTDFLNTNLSDDWDVEISETHHRFKKDRPSGTALTIADIFDEDIHTSSKRLGNVAGDHTVDFGNLSEIISVSHRALSRRTFAEGVLKSAHFITKKDSGFYSFKDVLFGK